MAKSALDKDLKKVGSLETATFDLSRSLAAPGLAFLFLLAAMVLAALFVEEGPFGYLVIIASVIAGYMALNIGANDVANNMGPSVGSRALTMVGAITIAAICEASGALLAGGDVVDTISSELLRPGADLSPVGFTLVMMAALLSSALWINLATVLGAPVSTTHSVVGGVIGSGVAAAGLAMVNWQMMTAIVASWVISPALGGILAALLLTITNATIVNKDEKVEAARIWVPVLIGLMTAVFAMYMAMKGFSRLWDPSFGAVAMLGLLFGGLGWALSRPWVLRRSQGLENRSKSINGLFRLPLIFAAALLSFAHGANDVANAVGPLAAIVAVADSASTDVAAVLLPIWVLAIGAAGIAVGLALFGPKLIRTVGERITKMNEIRAYCVALSAATTVLIASALGLPVSSTHIAIGAVFGVGFLRELTSNKGVPNPAVQPRSLFLQPTTLNETAEEALANFQKRERRRLVRRQHAFGIAAAWVITVPASALLSALVYFMLEAVVG
ncbi:inorganic phosphate transporter [Pararhizobium haloflavum]|uniref:inorganic phosphate transporter n=1 Tax=Pararhizobium haloflavum TaxID=2037914 RepID=UPI000C1A37AE|nr:inorganic phosphate transporter [Pararhizobium haloflavum]